MPRPVKTDRPVTTEPVSEPIQGTTIVVIHPGSTALKLGRATDHFAHSVPHVIARRINNGVKRQSMFLHRKAALNEDSMEKMEFGLSTAKSCVQAMRLAAGVRKNKVPDVASFNKQVVAREMGSDVMWTNTENHTKEIFIGEQALNLSPDAPYDLCWPIRGGRLNLHTRTPSSLAHDLAALWGTAIQDHLDIPVKDLPHYRAVIILPDMMDRNHCKVFIDVALNHLNFSCVLVHQESVCNTFGSGLSSACVVDVGSEKTTINCVEDGISIPASRMRLNFGGDDITRVFYELLKTVNFPHHIDTNNLLVVQLLTGLKETFCHLSLDLAAGKTHEFQVVRPGESSLVYQLMLGDEPLLAPTAMFIPDLFGLIGEELIETYTDVEHNPDDLMDDRYLLEKREGEGKKTRVEGEEEFVPSDHQRLQSIKYDGMPLDEAIMYSIEKCNNTETKRKMYSTVLLVGGGLNFKSVDEFLLKRLQAHLPPHYQFVKQHMEVITKPKERDGRTTCWKGGCVMSILDSSQELWISSKEWITYNTRIVRERCGFQWSSNMDRQ